MEPQKNVRLETGTFSNDFEGIKMPEVQINDGNFESYTENKIERENILSQVESLAKEKNPTSPMGTVSSLSSNDDIRMISPSTASDNNLMEDEWVRDLKLMIAETKGDPYMREKRFRLMQVDYLRKRYNRIINGGK